MNPQWREFLLQHQAVIEHEAVVSFNREGSSATDCPESFMCDLSGRGLISITGADAVSFMQGQFTTNVPAVTPKRAQLSAWCSPKGRVLAVFTLSAREDGYLLMMPKELTGTITNRLELYVLRSQVVVEDVTHRDLICIGCQGPDAQTRLEEFFGDLPDTPYDIRQSSDGLSVMRVPGRHPRYELVGSQDSMQALWTELSPHLCPRGEAGWSLGALEVGVPTIRVDTADEYLPQMLNLELIGGVDFNKGCYAGQEIVARAHYLGKVKRRMYLGGVQSSSLPARGSALVDGKSDRALGKIVDAVRTNDDQYLALAVLSVDCLDAESVHLETPGGPEVRLTAFPYMEDIN